MAGDIIKIPPNRGYTQKIARSAFARVCSVFNKLTVIFWKCRLAHPCYIANNQAQVTAILCTRTVPASTQALHVIQLQVTASVLYTACTSLFWSSLQFLSGTELEEISLWTSLRWVVVSYALLLLVLPGCPTIPIWSGQYRFERLCPESRSRLNPDTETIRVCPTSGMARSVRCRVRWWLDLSCKPHPCRVWLVRLAGDHYRVHEEMFNTLLSVQLKYSSDDCS